MIRAGVGQLALDRHVCLIEISIQERWPSGVTIFRSRTATMNVFAMRASIAYR
jgi:hypothetical protein